MINILLKELTWIDNKKVDSLRKHQKMFLLAKMINFLLKELTRIELEFLCFLGPEELVNAFARESSSHHHETSNSG
jgi:hypothetical protein